MVLVDPATGEAVTKDPSRSIPLDSPEAIGWYFGVITEKAFPLAVAMRTRPRDEGVDAEVEPEQRDG